MCGLAGIYNFDASRIDLEILKAFTDSMVHRGPDGFGYELLDNGKIGLGHRRLSILDLTEAGHQPFHYLDRYSMVYNGEIFNFNTIKEELISLGYQFKSNTDTEVILAAFDCYGLDCFDRFNGMWAIAIWDNINKKLLLCRDRFGVKPLYYAKVSASQFVFASETRAFKFLKHYKRSIQSSMVDITLKNNYALEGLGYTIFNDIYQLLPGHYMEITASGLIQQKRWYDIREKIKPIKTYKEVQVESFYMLFRDACRIRLISDVPVATALSGGLDSSSIYSTVFDILKTENNDRISKDSQLAVSAIFPGLENDEKEYVDKAIDYTKGDIKWIITDTINLTKNIEKETELFDAISNAPITAVSAIYKGMKSEHITVSLDGHGVDEMLFGYLYMVYDLWLLALEHCDKEKALQFSKILSGLYHPNHQENQLEVLNQSNLKELRLSKKLKFQIKKLLKQSTDFNYKYLPINLPSLSDKPYDFSKKSADERMLFYEFFQNSLPALLRNFDRAGMMNSVEIRMPFLDFRVVEYIFSLPIEGKIGMGFTKRILRDAMKLKIDESVRSRTFKVGIGSPFQYWADQHLKEWLYNQTDLFSNEEKITSQLHLDQYYRTKNLKDLEAVWYRINLKLIA